jgi:hypothetical protein
MGQTPNNRKEMYGLIRNIIYPNRANRLIFKNPYMKKLASAMLKADYWTSMMNNSERIMKKVITNWEKLVIKGTKVEKMKIVEKRKFCIELEKKFSSVIAEIKKVFKKKIIEPAKDLLVKENKIKRKKLRWKWRKLINDHNSQKFKEMEKKFGKTLSD